MVEKSAEERLAHMREKNSIYRKRYREKYKAKFFSVQVTSERFDLLNSKLEELGITKKQFLENAIDSLLKE